MAINYKRLNDNTYDDAYKIPNKYSLTNFIQGCKYFSQLELNDNTYDDSKHWTTFSCPCGLHE